ncbi:MAG: DUF4178 domain-containing protein [Bacillota bacterium]
MGLFKKIFGSKEKKQTIIERNPFNLQLNDIVDYDLVEYQVIGKITYEQDGYIWYDYHLFDSKNHLWLYAEDDDMVKLGLFKRLESDHPLYAKLQDNKANSIEYEGKTYSLIEKGDAIIQVEGQVGARNNQKVRYWDYETDDGSQISVEKWGNEMEISVGRNVHQSLLEFYPAK